MDNATHKLRAADIVSYSRETQRTTYVTWNDNVEDVIDMRDDVQMVQRSEHCNYYCGEGWSIVFKKYYA